MRTTGMLHLGHYVGALKQWLEVQATGEYECYFLLADVQALTTHSENPEMLSRSVHDVAMDWLAVGLDPTLPNVHFVLQSQVPTRYELSALLMMIARYGEVTRNPTLKAELKNQKSPTMGFMAYPVDQVADICMVNPFPKEEGDEVLVPVGEDQVPHLEYARDLAQRFNLMYGPVFTPCSPLVGKVGRLPGLYGDEKMSKSISNTIDLTDDTETVKRKIMKMPSDPGRTSPDVPGDPEKAPAFLFHDAFNPNLDEIADLKERYKKGTVGDGEVKQKLVVAVNNFLDPIRERRSKINPDEAHGIVSDILRSGTEAAHIASMPVLAAVRDYMHLGFTQKNPSG